MKRILITGAAGKIGDALRKGLRGSYSLIRLADIAPFGTADTGEEVYATDIRDIAALDKAMAGIDCVVHLAGVPEEAEWDTVLSLNIEGCFNVFESARRQALDALSSPAQTMPSVFIDVNALSTILSPPGQTRAMAFQKCLVRRLVASMLINTV